MHKIAKYAIATNLIVGLIFIYCNLTLWDSVNAESPYVIASHWSPLGIVATHYVISDGSISMLDALYLYFNFPFWLFFVALAVNLYVIYKLSKEQSTTQN